MSGTDVSVVIVASAGAAHLRMALAHLELQAYPSGRFEVVIVAGPEDAAARDFVDRYCAGAPMRTGLVVCPRPGWSAARNAGVAEARGRWLLFLDEDLLAGAQLVRSHVHAQEQHGGSCAVVGRILSHPQATPASPVRNYWWDLRMVPAENGPLHYMDWRAFNLSLSRQAVLDAGGFDPGFGAAGLDETDLARRLAAQGVQGYYHTEACAFTWRGSTLSRERERHYRDGYGLYRLAASQPEGEALARYRSALDCRRQAPDRVLAGAYAAACRMLRTDSPLYQQMSRRILRHEFCRGYRDARKGRPLKA